MMGAAWGLPAWVGYIAVRSFAIATGHVNVTTLIMLCAIPLYCGLSWWLIFGGLFVPALGAFGVGIAYAITAYLVWGMLIITVRLSRQTVFNRTFYRPFTWNWTCIKDILHLGVPFACQILLSEGILPIAGFIMVPFGSAAIAAFSISTKIHDLLGMVSFGLSETACVRLSIGLGAGRINQIRQSGWIAIQLSLIFNCLCGIFLTINAKQIVGWFLGQTNITALALTTSALPVTAGVLLLNGTHAIMGGILNGLKEAKGPLYITAFCAWGVGLPVGFCLAHALHAPVLGLWIGLLIGHLCILIFYLALLRHRLERLDLEFKDRS